MKQFFLIFSISSCILIFAISGNLCFGQSNTILCGKIIDAKNETITIYSDGFSIYKRQTIAEATVDENGYFCFKFYISEPCKLSLLNKLFYVKPLDSVFIDFQDNSYIISGQNADNYRYALKYDSLVKNLQFKYYLYNFKDGLNSYPDSLNQNRIRSITLLNNSNIRGNISRDLYAYALNQIKYNYFNQLLYPIASKNYPVELLPDTYTSILDQISLTNDSLVKNREYAFTALNLIQYKKQCPNTNTLDLILNNSTRLTRQFLLTDYAFKLINNYTSTKSAAAVSDFKQIEKEISDPEFVEYFNIAKEKFEKYVNPFPAEVLNSKLTDSSGKNITFKELLHLSEGRVLVLDFWASWCGPCIHGMPLIHELNKKYKNSKIDFIFISLDKTSADWRTGLIKVSVPGNHYFVEDNFKSILAVYLDIITISRYVIINKNGKLENMDARSPSEGIWLDHQIEEIVLQ